MPWSGVNCFSCRGHHYSSKKESSTPSLGQGTPYEFLFIIIEIIIVATTIIIIPGGIIFKYLYIIYIIKFNICKYGLYFIMHIANTIAH